MVWFCRLKNESVLWLTICFIYCRLSMSWIDSSSLFCGHQLTSLLKANYNQLSTEPEEVVQVLDFLHFDYTLTSTLFLHISLASWLCPPIPKVNIAEMEYTLKSVFTFYVVIFFPPTPQRSCKQLMVWLDLRNFIWYYFLL